MSGEANLRAALRDLYEDYADCLDAFELDRWPEFFVDDCRYRVTSAENYSAGQPLSIIYCDGRDMLLDRVVALRETTFFEPRSLRHFISGTRIVERVDAKTVRTTANYLIIESIADQEPQINTVGRYLDTVVQDGDRLLFKDRWCVYDNWRINNSLVIPV
ncbi:MAG: nuclear transport factor 2 family protein [Burkholderiaceae bacterium]